MFDGESQIDGLKLCTRLQTRGHLLQTIFVPIYKKPRLVTGLTLRENEGDRIRETGKG